MATTFDLQKEIETLKRQKTTTAGFDVQKEINALKSGQPTADRVLAPSPLLRTETGLTSVAERAGVGEKAQTIIAQKGEDPEKIFSGGFVSDVFDTINTLDHGIVGILQGKGFYEGISTRASFTKDEDLKKLGPIPQFVVGLAMDIAVDPFTYIAPWTVLGKIGKVAKLEKPAQLAGEALTRSRIGQKLGNMFVYRFGQDPIYRMIDERRIANIAGQTQNIVELSRPLRKLNPAVREAITTTNELGQTIRRPISELQELTKGGGLPQEVLNNIEETYKIIDDLSEEYVRLGLLPADIRENVGQYLRNSFREYETGQVATKGIRPPRLDTGSLKARKDLSDEVREQLGQILDAGYLLPDTAARMIRTVENAKFFDEVAVKWAKDTMEVGLEKLPQTAELGKLAGKYVPEPIAASLKSQFRQLTGFEKFTRPIVGGFKFGKVILNPATHARNIVSNTLLNSFEGMSFLKPKTWTSYFDAAKELKTKGKWYQEAKTAGLGLSTHAANEISSVLLDPANGFFQKFGTTVSNVANSLADIYQKEEEFAKLAQFIFQRKGGKSVEEAWRIAERATFNYAQVTPFIRTLRENIFGFPFITFTYKAAPQVAKTALTAPTRISNIGKIKNAIENLVSSEELKAERAAEPDWIRDNFLVRLPIKDAQGRSAYFDLTYIIPFGDLVSGELVDARTSRETGLPEGFPLAVARKAPTLNLLAELMKNQDFFGNRVFKDSDPIEQQLGDVFRHIAKTYLPPLIADQIEGGYRSDGQRQPGRIEALIQREQGVEEGGFQARDLQQELLRQVGLKITPFELEIQEKRMENEKERALQTLLEDEGIIRQFSIPYTPKK